MSIDQELFEGLARILIDNCSLDDNSINYLVYVHSMEFMQSICWHGRLGSGKSSFSIKPSKVKTDIQNVTLAIYRFYHENELNKWNVMHFKVEEGNEKFKVEFEANAELQSGELGFHTYCDKFQ